MHQAAETIDAVCSQPENWAARTAANSETARLRAIDKLFEEEMRRVSLMQADSHECDPRGE